MADFVFNQAKGKVAYYAGLPAANDALVAVVIQSTGIQSDATMKDLDTVAQVVAGSTEQTTMGRKTVSGVTVTVDDTADKVVVDFADITWTAATGNNTGKLVIGYDPDTTGGTDADIVPLLGLDFAATPNGGDITYVVNAAGAYDAS